MFDIEFSEFIAIFDVCGVLIFTVYSKLREIHIFDIMGLELSVYSNLEGQISNMEILIFDI